MQIREAVPKGVALATKGLTSRVYLAALNAAQVTPGIKRYKLGACLYDHKGRIINSKGNLRKTHPALVKFTAYPYLHAESHCILGHGLDNCSGLSLFVLRLSAAGQATMAKPCDSCLTMGRYVGLDTIKYTNADGLIECV